MPVFYQHTVDADTRLAIWKIEEPEDFFLDKVPVSRAITHPAKRLQHLAGRYLLQYLFPDFPLRLIQIAHTRKPYLPEDPFHFSISHCGQWAAAIVSTHQRVGIDIEEPTPRILKVMHKFLSEAERGLIVPHSTEQLILTGTLFWSAKEAMYKWYSHGELDFTQHMHISGLHPDAEGQGRVEAHFLRHNHIQLSLPFVCWEGLVLSYVAV